MKTFLRTLTAFVFFFAGLCPPAFAARELPLMEGKTLSLDLQNANLKDVLKVFSQQSGLNFIASQTVEDRKITMFLENVPIREGMVKLFEANNLTYEFDEAANIYIVKYWGEPQMDMQTKIYRLKNRSVSSSNLETEKVALMSTSGMGNGLSSTAGAQGATTVDETTGIIAMIKQVMSKEGKVCEDKRTNSLIVTDIPSRFLVIDELIAKLDVPQPMILLEVEMLDVSRGTLDTVGLNVGTNPLTLDFHNGKFYAGSKANNGSAGYLTMGNSYALLLDFLRTQSDTRYLARPKIMTLNNETAEIGVTRDEVVNKKLTVSSTGTSSSTTVTEYERATSLSLTPEGIGVFLRVTPQVNLDTNEITMVVNPKTSSTTQSDKVTDLALDPEVRMTKSVIKMKDGETVVLGGLIHQEHQETITKLPILGELPFVGGLFRHKSVGKDADRELLVFITPRIVKESGSKLAKAENGSSALTYLSSGLKRQQDITDMLDTYEK